MKVNLAAAKLELQHASLERQVHDLERQETMPDMLYDMSPYVLVGYYQRIEAAGDAS